MAGRKRKIVDLSRILAGHAGRWVALAADESRVVASSGRPRQALRIAKAKGERDPILLWAPRKPGAYIV